MADGKKRVATLVGCNYHGSRYELHGCINDAHAMRDVLVRRFGFDPRHVELLTDAPGAPVPPTGANIHAALARMVDGARPGDVLFFHYSGHGTWFPSAGGGHRRRGSSSSPLPARDEAIVPCDFNLITDLDFRQLVNRLPAGASLTIVSDSCHSGGLIDQEKEQIGPSSELQAAKTDLEDGSRRRKAIPFDSVLAHLTSLSGIDSPDIADHLKGLFGHEAISDRFRETAAGGKAGKTKPVPPPPDEGILLSGCQANETSADMCPEGKGGRGRAYGAFSNAIQTVLKEHEGPLSNKELVALTREVLRRETFAQHPCLYCSDENAAAPFLWQRPDSAM